MFIKMNAMNLNNISSPQYGSLNMTGSSGYQSIELDFEPSHILFWTDGNYSAFYTNDENAPYEVFLSQASNSQHYNLPRDSRQGYYCEIKNLNGKTLEIWCYGTYTLYFLAFP